ncbi:MAG: 6-phosphofructokinase [Synergistaceae bacterium]|nr:6-phosphofructokinase [Synergistaceae bacterium]MBQ6435157.1 6-phosphofructokinase [Synergistaceae bacterium]MBQ7068500.1 6-phosphofructokinase [Synergistaceae bacterium]MBR0076061.1 6-phosphofructokinase [Synergistaceae bacterium]MBR0080448.1 6-phosphofructokinase [Synergistaceae bacterium]
MEVKKGIKNIGIITSGGDCGGLNAVIRGAAKAALMRGIRTFTIPNGYAGLYNLVNFDKLVELDEERTDHVNSSFAGSDAGHSRVKISKINDPDKYERIEMGLRKHNLDALLISGGDDTGSVVVDLSEHGIPCVHAPKTMDLDLQTYSVGGDSAINKIAKIVDDLKTTGTTHNRIMVIEVFGRYAGHTAFRGGIAADADCILIPEVPVDFDAVYAHMKHYYIRRILNSDVHAGTYTIVVAEGVRGQDGQLFSEGGGVAKDSFGHPKLAGAGKFVKDTLENKMKDDPEIKQFMKTTGMYVPGVFEIPEIREVIPSHIVRSGETSAYDVNFGKQIGAAAVILLDEGVSGVTVVKMYDGKIRYMPTAEAIAQRFVGLETVSFYEQMDVCFGRPRQKYQAVLEEVHGAVERLYS